MPRVAGESPATSAAACSSCCTSAAHAPRPMLWSVLPVDAAFVVAEFLTVREALGGLGGSSAQLRRFLAPANHRLWSHYWRRLQLELADTAAVELDVAAYCAALHRAAREARREGDPSLLLQSRSSRRRHHHRSSSSSSRGGGDVMIVSSPSSSSSSSLVDVAATARGGGASAEDEQCGQGRRGRRAASIADDVRAAARGGGERWHRAVQDAASVVRALGAVRALRELQHDAPGAWSAAIAASADDDPGAGASSGGGGGGRVGAAVRGPHRSIAEAGGGGSGALRAVLGRAVGCAVRCEASLRGVELADIEAAHDASEHVGREMGELREQGVHAARLQSAFRRALRSLARDAAAANSADCALRVALAKGVAAASSLEGYFTTLARLVPLLAQYSSLSDAPGAAAQYASLISASFAPLAPSPSSTRPGSPAFVRGPSPANARSSSNSRNSSRAHDDAMTEPPPMVKANAAAESAAAAADYGGDDGDGGLHYASVSACRTLTVPLRVRELRAVRMWDLVHVACDMPQSARATLLSNLEGCVEALSTSVDAMQQM